MVPPPPPCPFVQGRKTAGLMFGLSFFFVFTFPTLTDAVSQIIFSTTRLNQFICVVCHQNLFIMYKLI